MIKKNSPDKSEQSYKDEKRSPSADAYEESLSGESFADKREASLSPIPYEASSSGESFAPEEK